MNAKYVLSPEQELKLVELRRAFKDYVPTPGIHLHFDKDGEPIDMAMYHVLMEDLNYKRVALTEVNGYSVSTVWLGIDYSFMRGAPIIFETMVFGPDGSSLDLYCERYCTEEEARQGHEDAVTLVRGTT